MLRNNLKFRFENHNVGYVTNFFSMRATRPVISFTFELTVLNNTGWEGRIAK
jgi:hypothetical protein